MTRGPIPKPTALKILEGNPGQRKLNGSEPQPTRGAPLPPGGMSVEALAEWGRVVPELDRLGLLTSVDRAFLVTYCEAWSALLQGQEAIRVHGPLVRGREGQLIRNPASQVIKDSADLMLKFGSRFGLSPSDRSRLSVNAQVEDAGTAAVLSILS